MVLKLDPRVPIVWRDPTTLQFGVARPLAVVTEVGTAVERMVAALVAGISPSGLVMTGKAAGATDHEVAEFLARLRPALSTAAEAPPPIVVVVGTGPTVDRLAEALGAAGIRVRLATSASAAADEPCDLGIVVARYVVAPELHSLWLRRDIPHLAVVLADAELTVGPVVEPGAGPCLHCLHRYRVEQDAAWPAIATQLLARSLPLESPLVADEAAAIAARMVLSRLGSRRRSTSENGRSTSENGRSTGEEGRSTGGSITISTATGERSEQSWVPHPDCGCIDLAGDDIATARARPGTGSPDDDHRGAPRLRTTRSRASAARA